MFILKDSTGQAYNETITDIGKPLDGTVQTIDKLRGQMIYEVPADEHSFTFQFQDSTYYANVGTWNINIKYSPKNLMSYSLPQSRKMT